jgi:8-oxo-dGTP pyrophosphatase MutT (NUDIX family)
MTIDLGIWKEQLQQAAGLKAQLLMAPELRKEELEKYKASVNQQKSAVLVLIYLDNYSNQLHLVLTKRSSKLRKHSGQISFPGGKMDKSDASIEETALREAEEEIGIDRNSNIEIIGSLSPLLIPVTGFKVFPIVAFSHDKPAFYINDDEVEELLLVKLDDIISSKNIKQKVFSKTTSAKGHLAPYFNVNNVEVWGATAMILSELIVTLFPNSDFANHQHSFY